MYIRTKDWIYDTSKGLYTPSIKMWAIGTVTIYDEDILKQAETIEELCDEFVVECFNKSYHAISEIGYDELKHNTQTLSPTDTIYGAIWCEWGLKYVAKLNSKGELELI